MMPVKAVLLVTLLCAALPATAQNATPPANDRRAAIDKLLGALKTAPSEEIAGPLEQPDRAGLADAGTPAVTLLMSRGLREMKADARQDAIEDFSDAITLDPNLAEAYHQRAIARFTAGDTPGAIADIQATLPARAAQLCRIPDACRDRRGAQGLERRLRRLAEGDGDRSQDPGWRGAPEGPASSRAGRGGVASPSFLVGIRQGIARTHKCAGAALLFSKFA